MTSRPMDVALLIIHLPAIDARLGARTDHGTARYERSKMSKPTYLVFLGFLSRRESSAVPSSEQAILLSNQGLLVSISTGIGFSVAQAAFFRSKAVRKALELPFVPQATVKPPTVMESITYGATQAQERGWAKKIMSMFKIPGLSEAVPTAAAAEGKVSKAKATRAPRGDFMERPKSRH